MELKKYFNSEGDDAKAAIHSGLYNWLIKERALSIGALVSCLLICLSISFLTVKVHWVLPIVIVAAVIGGPFIISAMFKPKVGVYLMIFISVFMSVLLKLLSGIPIGLVMDFTILCMMLGMLYRCYLSRDWSIFHTPITIPIVLWAAYNVLEFANPIASSRVAWFYVVRPVVGYIQIFFITYGILKTPTQLKNILVFLLCMSSISGIWGLYQYFFGYFDFEMRHIIRNDAVHLVFIQGRWRSFGTMGSPAHYGIVMAYMSIVGFLMLRLKFHWLLKVCLVIMALCCFGGMIYAGARSAYAVLPIAGACIVGLSKSVKMYVLAVIAGIGLFIVIIMPTNNYHIKRIQSTFNASEDKSYLERQHNRDRIKPWILKHPIGGGLGSTGVWGGRFSPGSFLASFPPDSGYVRVAVETGWIGLIIYLFLWANLLIKGAWGYFFNMKDPELKTIALCIIVIIFPLAVVELAQEILVKLPSNFLFWIYVAILFRAIEMDKEKQNQAS
ncbi:O-antigen ligase family protein [Flammeovirgaceae bacterium SG7u.111]|nr:O-antigen ligase family protein [Flammeovirgaceae bacterium SG7u.132]WPO34557.1 O-antigen ligase family protein [Flammeovirgaceae bacterium SG7u.111]